MVHREEGEKGGRGLQRLVGGAVWLALVISLGACDSLLDVDNESDILDDDLNTPDAILPIVAGVAGEFGDLFSNTSLAVAQASFELWHTGSHGHDRETDEGFLRRPSNDGNTGFNNASQAYWTAGDALRRIGLAFDNPDAQAETAEVLVWGGYTLHMLADSWCQAAFDAGPAVPAATVRQMALDDFTRAIQVAQAAGSAQWELRAVAGRARARLMLDDYAGAVADAQQIPMGFQFFYDYSNNSNREENDIPGHTRDQIRRESGVHPRFFEDPLRWADSRTPMVDWGPSAVGPDAIRLWVEQDKYRDVDWDMLVSSWQEIRLIEAEAELRLGNLTRTVELIDEVRAAAGLAPYGGPVAEAEVLEQLMFERSAELWLQGQSLHDLRRTNSPLLDVPPGRGGGATRDKCFEIGEDEYLTNPNLGG